MNEYLERESILNAIRKSSNLYVDQQGLYLSCELIAEMPAADVQPIKHGRWVWVKNYRDCEGDIYSQYKCSCCDFGVGGVYSVKDLTHFCGGCGARMDGET